MSYSKIFLLAGIVVVIAVVSFLIFGRNNSTDKQVTDAISILKQGDDRTRDCEAFEKLVAFSPESKRATLMVAEMYARGMCQPFDLEKSIEWYRKANLSDGELGQAFFQAAHWEIPADGQAGPSQDQLMSLLKKAKELGYKPTQSELSRLPKEYAPIFQ
jgi:TPR repeat protein